MHKITMIFIITLLIVIISSEISLCISGDINNREILLNNVKEEEIKIEVIDIKVKNKEIDISEKYTASSIITMKVSNNSSHDMELSNIDIAPYQSDLPSKYFVSTSEENIHGFIGNLKSGESKIIKIGIGLHNTEDPIKLEICNTQDEYNKKFVQNINIK